MSIVDSQNRIENLINFVLFLYLCTINSSELNQQTFVKLQFLWFRYEGVEKLGGSGLKSSIGLRLHDQPGFLSSEDLSGAGGPTDSYDCQWEASVRHYFDLSMECFHVLTTWQLVSSRESDQRERKKPHFLFHPNLGGHTLSLLPCSIDENSVC